MTTQHTNRIVVGVDGSDEALRAVRWAAVEACRRGAALRLVTAFAWSQDRLPGWPGLGEARGSSERLRAAAEHALARAVTAATDAAPGSTVDHEVVVGFPAGVLLAESRHAGLIVVGSRGRGRIGALFAGSTAVAVSVHAACPAVVVRGEEHGDDPTAPVVVGIDGTPTSEAAVAFAFEAAAARRAPLVAVHTWVEGLGDPDLAALIDFEALATEEKEVLAERLAGWGEKYPDVEVRRIVARDGAAHTLIGLAKGAQLVVVGSRGHGEFTGLLLGSVSNALVHGAPCPVAVVRPAGD